MKRLHLLSLLLFCGSLGYAQLTYGVKAGLNYSHIRGNTITVFPDGSRTVHYESASDAVVRPLAGFWIYLPVSERLSLMTDLQAVQKSWYNNHINFRAQIGYELFYLSLPIQVSYRLKRVDFHLGPELSYLLDTKEKLGVGSFDIEPSALELGVVAGLSYHFNHWFINLRANRDLTPLFELKVNNPFSQIFDDFAVYHQGLQLSVGYHLPALTQILR
jgi:hypothetical protein